LRLDRQRLFLAVDSQVHINIKASAEAFSTGYRVSGSDYCVQMQELALLQSNTRRQYDSIQALFNNKEIEEKAYIDLVLNCIDEHKKQAQGYIFSKPASPVAYFALFQRIHKLLIFDPFSEKDNRHFAAVATAWNVHYPHSERTRQLVNLTMQGMSSIRKQRITPQDIPIIEIDALKYFEINLPNVFGQNIPLSSLEGKVILLDFTAFQANYSAARTIEMRELYNRYELYGFEIYQVSLDPDEHFWKTGALNLPWICVRDKNLLNSAYLSMYNVSNLPSYFLIDRQGNLAGRDETIQNLDEAIQKLL
jgi:peroxiredoxin